MELSLPKGYSSAHVLHTSPSTSKLVLPSKSIEPIDVPSLEPIIVDPNPPIAFCKTIHN